MAEAQVTVKVLCGDCLDVMPTLEAESFSACVTDGPYHLTSIVKRFGGQNAAPAKSNGATGVYGRASKGFMGKTWDGGDVAFRPETWAAVLRVMKPGAYLVAFASTRGYHRMVCAIEDAGFIIHPMLGWITGQGFPKATNLSKAIDRAAGAEREVVGRKPDADKRSFGDRHTGWERPWMQDAESLERYRNITAPATEAAKQWEGWAYGLQSLKPALEPICMAQKPFAETTSAELHEITGWDHWCSARSDGDEKIITARALHPETRSYRARVNKEGCEVSREDLGAYAPFVIDSGTGNVLRHGTGAINIDACRVDSGGTHNSAASAGQGAGRETANINGSAYGKGLGGVVAEPHALGRWPANVAHSGEPEVLEAFARFGVLQSGTGAVKRASSSERNGNQGAAYGAESRPDGTPMICHGDTGTAARFFFCWKAQPWEREGSHPTVKPVALMEWLVRLITPPGGAVLDPFCGTGSTLVACDWLGIDAIGIELSAETCADAERKIKRLRARRMLGDVPKADPVAGQQDLFAWP